MSASNTSTRALAMPPAVAPPDDVAELLDQLRAARAELTDAGRIVHMLAEPAAGEQHDHIARRRRWIEQQAAERRCELWALEIAQTEARLRGLDVEPAQVL